MSDRTKGFGLVSIAMVTFGMFGIFAKVIPVSPLMLLFSLQVVGAASFLLASESNLFPPLLRRDVKLLVAATLCILVADFSYLMAFKLLSVANAVVVRYTFPFFVVLCAPFMLDEAISRKAFFAVGLGLTGLLIVLAGDFGRSYNWYGILSALVSAVSFALFLICIKKLFSCVSPRTFLLYRYSVSFVILLPVLWIAGIFSDIVWSFQLIGYLLGFGLTFAVVATFIQLKGIEKIKVQEASVLAYLEPLSASVYGIFLLSEIPTLFVLTGGALIIASGIITIRQ